MYVRGGYIECKAEVRDNLSSAAYTNNSNTLFSWLSGLIDQLRGTDQKIASLQNKVSAATQSVSDGKQALSTKLGIDTSGGLPTFSIINQQIDQTRTDYYNSGVAAADGRALPGTVNYDTGYNNGVRDADSRSEPTSYNYKSGYEAGKQQGSVDYVFSRFYDKKAELNLVAGQEIPLRLDVYYEGSNFKNWRFFIYTLSFQTNTSGCTRLDVLDSDLNIVTSYTVTSSTMYTPSVNLCGYVIDKTCNRVIYDYSSGNRVRLHIQNDGQCPIMEFWTNDNACETVYGIYQSGYPIESAEEAAHEYVFRITQPFHQYIGSLK